MALISELDHLNIQTARLDETIAFFEDIFDLENRPEDRPDFGFPGAWLFAGDRALVHLVETDDPGKASGPLEHVAFFSRDFDGIVARLEERGIKHRTTVIPGSTVRQIFVREPNGARLEVSCH